MRLFCRTEKWKPLISDRERKAQWIVVLRRTYSVRGISVDFFSVNFRFSVVQDISLARLTSLKGLYAF